MGRPLPLLPSLSSSSSSSSSLHTNCNGFLAPAHVQHVFVYGNLRPDHLGHHHVPLSSSLPSQKAWLLGARLYSINRDGVERATLKLEESGYAVMGFVLSPDDSIFLADVLEECEKREHPPTLYERSIVEVVTESGQHMQAYVYHCEEVDRSSPVFSGNWLQR